MEQRIGVIDVGGGFRGIYAAGVLDYCMDQEIRFDVGIGVSAGSANVVSYAAGQRGRNLTFYTGYGMRKASAIGKEWFEQAAGFAAFITGKTLTEASGIAVNEGGYPTDADLMATTTMGIGDFLSLIQKIAQ